ncbi:MAG TPA: branched-chain amino acid transaminase [Nitrososphaerales archaeon]|nr:branched-chain amino acid transaminase [Nitrososphaerales archaeon]
MKESSKIWMDGKLVDWHDAHVHVLTHSLHYATGVFEGIRFFSTSKGPAVFRLGDHVTRFFDSAKIYLMKMPFTPGEITEGVIATAAASRLDEGYIRPLAYYGYGEMGLNPLPNKVSVAIAAWSWPSYLGEEAERRGVRCLVSSWRRIHPSILPPQAKATANYANSALAKVEALKAGYDEAIMLNMDGMVTEATGENVFRVKDGVVSTPPASTGVLRGITRDSVITLMKGVGLQFRRNDFSREEMYTSDEVFLSGTAAGVTAVREIDGRPIGSGTWPVTEQIKKAYDDAVHGKSPEYAHWLTPVGTS